MYFSLVLRRCVSIKNKEQLQFEEKKMSLALIGRYANYAVSSESSRKNNISLLFATQNLILRKGTKLTKRPWSRLLRPRPRDPSTSSSQTSWWSPFHLPTALTLRNVPWITIPYSFVAKHVYTPPSIFGVVDIKTVFSHFTASLRERGWGRSGPFNVWGGISRKIAFTTLSLYSESELLALEETRGISEHLFVRQKSSMQTKKNIFKTKTTRMLLHLFSHSYYWLNRFARRFFFLFFVSPFSLTEKPGLRLPPSRVWIGMVSTNWQS